MPQLAGYWGIVECAIDIQRGAELLLAGNDQCARSSPATQLTGKLGTVAPLRVVIGPGENRKPYAAFLNSGRPIMR